MKRIADSLEGYHNELLARKDSCVEYFDLCNNEYTDYLKNHMTDEEWSTQEDDNINWKMFYNRETGEVGDWMVKSKVSITLTEKEWGKSAIVPTLNKSLRGHWSTTNKQKKKWTWIFKHYIDQDQIPKAKTDVCYFLIVRSYRKRLMDKDNLYGAHKWMIDALRGSGFIYDDDIDHIFLSVEQKKGTKKAGEEIKTVIERYLLTKL